MDDMIQISLFSTSPEGSSIKKEDECNVLHISDLHYGINAMGTYGRKAEYAQIMAERQSMLLNSLIWTLKENVPHNWKPDVIAISGDIAWSGQSKEYQRFQIEFLKPLLEALGLEKERVIAVPGNHDIDRNYVAREGHRLVAPIKNRTYKEAHVDPITKELITKELWHYFENFTKTFYPTEDGGGDGSKLCRVETYKEWPWLHFLALNSAWDCRGDQDAGCLRVGSLITEQLINEMRREHCVNSNYLKHRDRSDTVVAIFHHPCIQVHDFGANDEISLVNWLHQYEQMDEKNGQGGVYFNKLISESAHLVLSGHLHQKKEPSYSEKLYHFFSGTFFSPEVLEFHCRIIKIKKGKYGNISFMDISTNPIGGADGWRVSPPENIEAGPVADTYNYNSQGPLANQNFIPRVKAIREIVDEVFGEALTDKQKENIVETLMHSEFYKSNKVRNDIPTRRRNPER